MAAFLHKGALRDMSYNAPMRSGIVIDARALLVTGYAACQEDVTKALNRQKRGKWRAPDAAARQNNMQIDVDTKQASTVIPHYFIECSFSDEELLHLLKEYNLSADVRPEKDVRHVLDTGVFHLHALEIRVYDMGYGSVSFYGVIEGLRDLPMEEFRDCAARIGSQLHQYRPLFMDVFHRVCDALSPELISMNFLQDGASADRGFWKNSSLGAEIGNLFWVHRIFSVACKSKDEFERCKENCKGLIYSENKERMENASVQKEIAIYPGNGNSAVIYDGSQVRFEETTALASMVRALNVYYVAAEDIDRDLFYLSNELDRKKHSRDTSLLERHSGIIIDYQSRISFFQNIYDQFSGSLDPQSVKIWRALENAWETAHRFDAINVKLEMVEKMYNRIRDNLSSLQNQTLARLMLIFTLISSISVIADAINFTQEGALQFPSLLRVSVLILAALCVVFFALQAVRTKD